MVELTNIIKDSVLYGEFTLSSGKESNYYIDKYRFETNPRALDIIGEHIADKIKDINAKKIGGVSLGGVPLAAIASVKADIPYIIIRKKEKEYGTSNSIEGRLNKGEKIVIIEDIITTGNSSIEAIDQVRNQGGIVEDIIVVIDRQDGGKENLEKNGVNVHSLVLAEEILEKT